MLSLLTKASPVYDSSDSYDSSDYSYSSSYDSYSSYDYGGDDDDYNGSSEPRATTDFEKGLFFVGFIIWAVFNCAEKIEKNKHSAPRSSRHSPGLDITETVKRQADEDQVVAGMEDSYCLKGGHKMVYLDKNPYKNAIAVKCDKCFIHINIEQFYFNCKEC